MKNRTKLWLGVVLFLAGGAILALARESREVVGVGTTVGIVGMLLMVGSWLGRDEDDEGDR